MKFDARPATVEAFPWDGVSHSDPQIVIHGDFGRLWVEKSQAWCDIEVGDFIVTEPDGNGHYPCKPGIFAAKYEPEGRRWKWLSSTVELQSLHGYEMPLEDVALTTYIEWNTLALFAEVGEALREVDWKPWSKGLGRVNRDALIEELVDCMHFIGNILTAVGVSDVELWEAYRIKQDVNFDRVRDGYTARLGNEPT